MFVNCSSDCENCDWCRECEIDEDLKRLVPDMKDAGPTAAALLIECRANGPEGLQVSPSLTPVCNELAACYTQLPLFMLSVSLSC